MTGKDYSEDELNVIRQTVETQRRENPNVTIEHIADVLVDNGVVNRSRGGLCFKIRQMYFGTQIFREFKKRGRRFKRVNRLDHLHNLFSLRDKLRNELRHYERKLEECETEIKTHLSG